MHLKTKIRICSFILVLGLVAGCLGLVFKQKIVHTLRLGVQIHEVNIPRGVALFEKDEIGKAFEITGIVGSRADKVIGTMIPRDNEYEAIHWQELELNKGYPSSFRWEIMIPKDPHLFFVQSSYWDSKRLEDPILIRPALIFIVAGQSNASGKSEHLSISPSDNVYFGDLGQQGIKWRPAHDPGILHGGGSIWPLVGHELQQSHGLGVGFINVAVGGSNLAEWNPGTPYFDRLVEALELTKATGLTAVLWHQGESDHHLTAQAYNEDLENIIQSSRSLSKLPDSPWLVTVASLQSHLISEDIRKGQQDTIDISKHIYPGPDTDVIGMEYRDTKYEVHFTREGNVLASTLWLESLNAFMKTTE